MAQCKIWTLDELEAAGLVVDVTENPEEIYECRGTKDCDCLMCSCDGTTECICPDCCE